MWSESEFGVGNVEGITIHSRSRKSLSKASFMIYSNSGQSFSSVLGNSFPQDIAAICAKEKITTTDMLQGHIQATVERAKASDSEVVIVAQDTTFFNYSSHKKSRA